MQISVDIPISILCSELMIKEGDVLFLNNLQEKGNTPLHVAAKAGQTLQAELLAVYGADPGTQDSNGKTPVDYAR